MITPEKRSRISNRPAAYLREDLLDWLKEKFDTDFSFLADDLPRVVLRHRYSDIAAKVGLPLSTKYLQNLDSLGTGPRRFM